MSISKNPDLGKNPAEVLKQCFILKILGVILTIYNRLGEGEKEKSLSEHPAAIETPCLLDVECKLYEQLIPIKSKLEIEFIERLSSRQYEFRTGK